MFCMTVVVIALKSRHSVSTYFTNRLAYGLVKAFDIWLQLSIGMSLSRLSCAGCVGVS
jgi:hypothetical protein